MGDRDQEGSSSGSPGGDRRRAASVSGGLEERLRNALGEDDGEDLLFDCHDMESTVLPWLRALDAQILGACRADERLKPLLSVNAPDGGVVEDRLMIQLSQHFEASEVGMLARCLCLPLVSIRVGKVSKQGNLLIPTSVRGHLSLTLLPSSLMRISFVGDDGCAERLVLLRRDSENSATCIKEISEDSSGRSFVLKLPGTQVMYFWCSEKSDIKGYELLSKMKDLLRKRPSLSDLTGISETRLDLFVSHIQAQCLKSSATKEKTDITISACLLSDTSHFHEPDSGDRSSSWIPKSFRSRPSSAHTSKMHAGSLSPRSAIFKDGVQKSSAAASIVVREKPRRRGEIHSNPVAVKNPSMPADFVSTTSPPTSMGQSAEELSVIGNPSLHCFPSPCLSFPLVSLIPSSVQIPLSKVVATSSEYSPYYCWCPPCAPASQYNPSLRTSEISTQLSRSSILSSVASPSSLLQPKKPFNITDLSILDLPAHCPEPFFCLSLPISSLVSVPITQPVPIFTPMMSDPIVHIPIIDVCSSGQGYLVSAGPSISVSLPPLLPNVSNARSPDSQLMIETNAKETLQMLIASAPIASSPLLARVLPSFCATESHSFQVENHHLLLSTPDQCLGDESEGVATARHLFTLMDLSSLKDCGANNEEYSNETREGSPSEEP